MKPKIGLSDKQREGVAMILAATLADEYVLGVKTKNYHWNVVGPHFHDIHKLLDAQYEEIEDAIDDTAERIRALALPSPGTLKEFLAASRLTEGNAKLDAKGMIADLLESHETLIAHLRQDLEACATKHGDAGNQDFLTGLMEQHEKMAWMLRAILG
jgi:starvation-inducible DNA-binding protein